VYSEHSKGQVDSSRTVITTQQKLKYMMHIWILVVVHIFCFWFIPIQGNIKLYGTAECNLDQEQFYGCKNFKRNELLQYFYVIMCMYLMLSSL